jgi:HEAT repeat protein
VRGGLTSRRRRDESEQFSQDLVRVRRRIRSKDVGGLADFVRDESVDRLLRFRAIRGLGRIADVAAVEPLMQCATRPDKDERIAAVLSLARLATKEAVPALVAALNDSHPIVAAWAADGLGKLGDPSAIPALLTALESDEWQLRGASARALGRIGGPQAVAALAGLRQREQRRKYRVFVTRALRQARRQRSG